MTGKSVAVCIIKREHICAPNDRYAPREAKQKSLDFPFHVTLASYLLKAKFSPNSMTNRIHKSNNWETVNTDFAFSKIK